MTNLFPRIPTAEAKDLDPLDLPVGTYVSWNFDPGWGRAAIRRWGEITSRTEKSYFCKDTYGDTARIARRLGSMEVRGFQAMMTPDELHALYAANRASTAAAEEARRQRQVLEDQERLIRKARQAAFEALAERHEEEFEHLFITLLEEPPHD